MRRMVLLFVGCVALSGCSCKEWGYCPHIFPNAERFVQNSDTTCTPQT